ncbi:LTA synthase family protein [Tepidibacter hydrothermalis]|uniref:LTA synthase family protein n=1 Tax=Tepidibacter hydrothermalis TaxID=3036126 RepID=A0ABY8EIM5_9FIRM|nr:LTA synthase family protein [Tepidibacter hydrothermalis]WFD11517.1 LTA synthase family protein [Tepidibacter hydrothermalis]
MLKNMKNYNFSLIIFVFILKMSLYYHIMGIKTNFEFITLLSVIYIGLIYTFLSQRKKCFFGVYIFISLFMFVDVIYFKYFNQSLSFNIVSQASQLVDVLETIKMLVGFKECLLFLDILVIYYLNKSNNRNYKDLIKNKKLKYKVSLISIICISMVLFNPFNNDLVKVINNEEFFTYHIKDMYSVIARKNIDMINNIIINLDQNTTENAKLYGIAKDRNLIVIQVESLQNMVVNRYYDGQELTPNLNKLIKKDSIYFNNYYQQLGKGNTSDAEFVSQNSLYAPMNGQAYDIYKDNHFYGLPWILRDKGYKTIAFHGYKKEFWNRDTAYPGQGFETFISEKDYKIEENIGFGLGDKSFFKQSIDYMRKVDKPFYSFLVTLTSHNPYKIPLKENVIELKEEEKGNLFGDYLQAVHYTDKAIGEFISYLKDNNLYKNSIIVIYGDHFGLSSKDEKINKNVRDFLGYDYDFDEMMKVPLIINIPGENVNQTIETVGGQIDFMPTILNLMGIENKNPFTFGKDIVNSTSGFVASQTYMIKGSFIQDNIIFEMSRDGVFENSRAWNRVTREPVDLKNCREGYKKAIKEINRSIYILDNDALRQGLK